MMEKKEIEERKKILTEILRHEFDVYTRNLPWKNYTERNLYLSGKKIYQGEDPIVDLANNIIEMLRLK
ncbi:hypothetical protein ES705_29964 [subsurface metagenome]